MSLFLSDCAKEEISLYGNLAGVVYDATTNEPIKGAEVALTTGSVSKGTFTTGKDGHYSFTGLTSATYKVQVSAESYKTDTKEVFIKRDTDNLLDFNLSPASPVLEVSRKTIDFGKAETDASIVLSNKGFANLNWEVKEQISWLRCDFNSGVIEKGKDFPLMLYVDRSGMDRMVHTGTLTIESNGGSAEIKVTIDVEGMSVTVKPSELDFGENITILPLTLESSKEVRYYLEPSDSWIIPRKTEGLFSGTEYLDVTVNRAGLPQGEYDGKLTLRVGDAAKEIPVRMSIPVNQAPVVVFYSVEDISYASATFKGAVAGIGSSNIIRHGFCWSEKENPTIETAQSCDFKACSSAKGVTYTASDLKAGTIYHVCLYAENSTGISYSDAVRFTTAALPEPPTVETGGITKITHESAEVSGNILNVGNDTGITEHGHVWSTSSNPTVDNPKTALGPSNESGMFSSSLSGLSPNVTYYVKAYAVNSIGISYGEEKTFTTMPDVMTVSTSSAEDVTHCCATLGGNITYDGGNVIAERGVCWSQQKGPTIEGEHKASTDLELRFSVRVETLSELTSYFFRAYAIAENGKVYYGNDVSFTTTHEIRIPKVSGVNVSDIGTAQVSISATVSDAGRGKISDAGFVLSRTINPTITDTKVSCGAQTESFASVITGLSDNTTYYVRAYVTNEAGTGYGEETYFTTAAINPPTLSSVVVSSVTYNSAAFSANVVELNNGTLKDAGFVYSTSENPDLNSSRISCGSYAMLLTTTATSLAANTTYHVRAYATNEKGTAYGASQSFTTAEAPQIPVVKTGTVSGITASSAAVSGEIIKMGTENGVTEYGHVWSETAVPTTKDFKTSNRIAASVGTYSSELTGLSPNVTYHVRAYAVNELGTAYGEEVTFTTDPAAVALSAVAASDVTYNAATLGGKITYCGGNTIVECGVCWSSAGTPTTSDAHKAADSGTDEFSVRAEGLAEGCKYIFRPYAVTESGKTYYGGEMTFTTTYEIHLPELSDVEVLSVTHRSASFAANVTELHHGTLSDAGFVWSMSPYPDMSDNVVSSGTSSTYISGKATPLEALTTYYVRAYAVNEKGIAYSEQITFTTKEKAEGSDFDIEDFEGGDNDWN